MKKAINLFLTIGLLASLLTTKVFAQAYVPGNEQNEILISGSSGSILLPNMNPFSFDVKKGHIKVRTDFGGNYWYINGGNNDFNIDITFDVEYYENGFMKAKGQYKNGDNEDGDLYLYRPDGSFERKMNCQEGICHTVLLNE